MRKVSDWQTGSLAGLSLVLALGLAHGQVQPIRNVRQSDNQGNPLLLNQSVTVAGVVTAANQFGSSGPAFIQDSTGGVALYGSEASGVRIGDSITVTGTVTLFYALTELDGLTLEANHGPVDTPAPRAFTIPQVSFIDTAAGYVENEGWLVRLDSVQIVHDTGAVFPSANSNWTIFDPRGDTGQMRVDKDAAELVGMLIPNGWIPLVGVIGQYQPNPPYFGGYQVMPRIGADLGVLPRPLITIAEAQRPGPDGVTPLLTNTVVRVRGRVTGPASAFSSGGANKSLYIQDETQGINVYGCSYADNEKALLDSLGVEWEVVARDTDYAGLTELIDGTMQVTDTTRKPVVPKLLPFNVALNEKMESDLVTVVGDVTQGAVRSGPGYNVVIKNGTPAITIRIDDKTGITVPEWLLNSGKHVRFTGIVGQYAYEPFTTGYQLTPRFQTDIEDTSGSFQSAARLSLDSIAPNPFAPELGQLATIFVKAPTTGYRVTVAVYDLEGRLVREVMRDAPGRNYSADLKWDGTDGLGRPQPAGIYLVNTRASNGRGGTETASLPVVLAVSLK